jgi:hypothetical protein
MTVKELINKLRRMPFSAEILAFADGDFFSLQGVEPPDGEGGCAVIVCEEQPAKADTPTLVQA